MHPNTCFALVLLGLAAVNAVPAGKAERKSAMDQPSLDTRDLKLEEIGDEKDRAKKSTFCVEIRPEGNQEANGNQMQTVNLVPQAPMASQVQTYNIQPALQPLQALQPVQTLQPLQALQPVQALSVVQAPQQIAQSIMVPQQMVPSVQTLQIIQPAQQPCPQSHMAEVEIRKEIVPQTTAAPTTTTTPKVLKFEKYVEEEKSIIDVLPQPLPPPMMSVVPVAQPCNDQIVVVPQKQSPSVVVVSEAQRLPTVVQIPHRCPHHAHQGVLCNCNTQAVAAMRSAAMKVDPMNYMGMRMRSMDHVHVHPTMGKQAHMHMQ